MNVHTINFFFSVALREGFAPFGSSSGEYAANRDRSHAFESSGVVAQRSFYLTSRATTARGGLR
jgi:hypothetical protein